MTRLLAFIGRRLVALRYRVQVIGQEAILARGNRGILLLPNHPALIDPVLLAVHLYPLFAPRALADETQLQHPVAAFFARRFKARQLPNLQRRGAEAAEKTRRVLDAAAGDLRDGFNVQVHPGGGLRRTRHEDLGARSAVEQLLSRVPETRVVLVRTTGLWGSLFSWGHTGGKPDLWREVGSILWALCLSGFFFMPKRSVRIELVEPTDFPRGATRGEINRYLERFYSAVPDPNRFVPYRWGQTARELPEPKAVQRGGKAGDAPAATRRLVLEKLSQLTGRSDLAADLRLGNDLGLDSLAIADLVLWVEREFGHSVGTPESLETVGDVVLAAAGGVSAVREVDLRPPGPGWQARDQDPRRPISAPDLDRLTDAFLYQARRRFGQVVVSDQVSGDRTFGDLVLAISLLRPLVAELPGRFLGIMLPASVGATVLFFTTLFAGKTPVMVNWTTGQRNIKHSLELLGVEKVLTSRVLLTRLESMGIELGELSERFLCVEDLRGRLTLAGKVTGLLRARLGRWFGWPSLARAAVPDPAVVLFTSGSESLPKAVPLSHANLLSNLQAIPKTLTVFENDGLLGILPPFHSFGLLVPHLMPLVFGLRTMYYPNPTEAAVLGQLIEMYGLTIMVGTPAFLNGIVCSATPRQIQSLRFAVTGAERCPGSVYEALAAACPGAIVLEGYGITECGPVVSFNCETDPVAGSIGRFMPGTEGVVVHLEREERAPTNQPGMLLVRGPSIFSGYLNYDGPSPFVEFEGKTWYRTGDLVRLDADGRLWFEGRLKRFVKIGGEMISLPAIETALGQHFPAGQEGPVIAVDAREGPEGVEILLFSAVPVERIEVNQWLKEAGFSPLCFIRRVVSVDKIPLLGTGKTDYRALAAGEV